MKSSNKSLSLVAPLGALAVALTGCGAGGHSGSTKAVPLQAIDRPVDLGKFMGDWYVIAHIPTFIETEAYNAVESYQLGSDGTIPTTFRFNKGGFDGPVKTYRRWASSITVRRTRSGGCSSSGRSRRPISLRISLPDYQTTVIGVPDRKYAWIMARTKTIPEEKYASLVKMLEETGHDVSKLRKVPQQ